MHNSLVRSYVGVTDGEWYRYLAARPELREVNFWRPSGSGRFGALSVGEPFFFKTHYPDNRVVGGGFYSDFAVITASEAWALFGEGNGAPSLEQMLARVGHYRRTPIAPGEDPVIGCVFIRDVCFFPPDESAPPPPDFAANIVQGKSYDLSRQPATAYFADLIQRMLGHTVDIELAGSWNRQGPVFGDPRLAPQRLGQQAFKARVLVAYDRRCADLDLAHVKPLDCLAYLHAKISKTPEKFLPVQPIIEYPWDDLPYSDELDALADLDTVQNLLDLDGFEFEKLMLQLFEAIPEFDEVRRTRSRADGGIDLVAVNTTPFVGGRVAIQAKRFAPHRKVDIAAVREVVGSISQREFNKGIIITTSGFTAAAREEATRLGVELYDCERLLWLLRQHLHREYNVIDHERRKAPIKNLPA